MSDDKNIFSIPEGLVEKIYEISGDSEKYKGLIMVVANESGDPIIYSKFDSSIMDLALRKALQEYLQKADNEKGDKE
jgi:CO dehydrogenase/acetyl-CoA synthase gamma subunit (corrinoid Fe-S protein)